MAYIFLRWEMAGPGRPDRRPGRSVRGRIPGRGNRDFAIRTRHRLHTSAGRYICGEEPPFSTRLRGSAPSQGKAAFSSGVRALGETHGRQQRGDPVECPPHHQEWRGLVPETEPRRGRGHQALWRERQGPPAGPVGAADGHPLREILEEHAGGMREGELKFRGLLPGGASTDLSWSRSILTCRWISPRSRKSAAAWGLAP